MFVGGLVADFQGRGRCSAVSSSFSLTADVPHAGPVGSDVQDEEDYTEHSGNILRSVATFQMSSEAGVKRKGAKNRPVRV